MTNISIFASGNGTNAENIIHYFDQNPLIKVNLLLSNNSKAFALKRAESHHIKTKVFNRNEFYNNNIVSRFLKKESVDFIVLAGFLWLIPEKLVKEYKNKIINIHPALLPKFGGKGMFGMHVHNEVIAVGEKESGITIHYVNEKYDDGSIIFQAKCKIEPSDNPESLAAKIHELEYQYFPKIIQETILGKTPNSMSSK